jgi:hypothetical protein
VNVSGKWCKSSLAELEYQVWWQVFEERDMRAAAEDVVRVVNALRAGRTASVAYTVEVFRGAANKTVRGRKHDQLPEHGLGKSMR